MQDGVTPLLLHAAVGEAADGCLDLQLKLSRFILHMPEVADGVLADGKSCSFRIAPESAAATTTP